MKGNTYIYPEVTKLLWVVSPFLPNNWMKRVDLPWAILIRQYILNSTSSVVRGYLSLAKDKQDSKLAFKKSDSAVCFEWAVWPFCLLPTWLLSAFVGSLMAGFTSGPVYSPVRAGWAFPCFPLWPYDTIWPKKQTYEQLEITCIFLGEAAFLVHWMFTGTATLSIRMSQSQAAFPKYFQVLFSVLTELFSRTMRVWKDAQTLPLRFECPSSETSSRVQSPPFSKGLWLPLGLLGLGHDVSQALSPASCSQPPTLLCFGCWWHLWGAGRVVGQEVQSCWCRWSWAGVLQRPQPSLCHSLQAGLSAQFY